MNEPVPAVVLDTNVVLDWLVFRDPGVARLAEHLAAGRLRWISAAPMLDELASVLRRQTFGLGEGGSEHVLTLAHRSATLINVAPPAGGQPVCSDRDDQKFIDLALQAPARWLVTRDKALLKLARAAARRGVMVCTPANWRPANS